MVRTEIHSMVLDTLAAVVDILDMDKVLAFVDTLKMERKIAFKHYDVQKLQIVLFDRQPIPIE